jgi:hypothetical protein
MLDKPKCPVIALEEHYWDKELSVQFVGVESVRGEETLKRLYDLSELRIREMDAAGIDMQVLSHGAPSAQKLSGSDAVALTRRVNDRLHAAVSANPNRFAAFSALPTSDPPTARSSTTSGSGRSSSARRRSMCRSICIPPCRCRQSWMPTTRITPRTSPW